MASSLDMGGRNSWQTREFRLAGNGGHAVMKCSKIGQ